MIAGEGRGIIIAANMWDKVDNKGLAKDKIYYQLNFSFPNKKNTSCVFIWTSWSRRRKFIRYDFRCSTKS